MDETFRPRWDTEPGGKRKTPRVGGDEDGLVSFPSVERGASGSDRVGTDWVRPSRKDPTVLASVPSTTGPRRTTRGSDRDD